MSKTAVRDLCAKCGEPLGDSVLLIGGRCYHHECSPYTYTNTIPIMPDALDQSKRENARLREALEQIAEHEMSFGADGYTISARCKDIARAALEAKP